MIVFTAIPFSPWSEKARWALDQHRIEYRYDEYVPFIGEIKLRIRMRKPAGRVTVPVLHDGEVWLTDSFDIARYADRIGSGARLFPEDKLAEIEAWNQRSEAALAAGRALAMLSMADDPSLPLAMLPPGIPEALKRHLAPVAKRAMQSFITKYRMRESEGSHETALDRELEALSEALAGRRYLLGDALSYADIAMAVALHVVSPVDARYMAGLSGADKMTLHAERVRRHADLFAWRDRVYAEHRRPRSAV